MCSDNSLYTQISSGSKCRLSVFLDPMYKLYILVDDLQYGSSSTVCASMFVFVGLMHCKTDVKSSLEKDVAARECVMVLDVAGHGNIIRKQSVPEKAFHALIFGLNPARLNGWLSEVCRYIHSVEDLKMCFTKILNLDRS